MLAELFDTKTKYAHLVAHLRLPDVLVQQRKVGVYGTAILAPLCDDGLFSGAEIQITALDFNLPCV